MKDKRKLGFLRGKGSIPDQKQLEEMDQEVSSQFFRDLMESAQEAVEIHQGKRSAARRTLYKVNPVTKSVIGVSLEIGNFCTLSALFNQSWFVRG